MRDADDLRSTTDTAAYWAPSLYVNDEKVAALDAAIYYRRNTIAPVKPFPVGFMMIGGDSTAAAIPQSTNTVFWNCSIETSTRRRRFRTAVRPRFAST